MDRYIVIDDSYTKHCCFAYSVIDTADGKSKYGDWQTCLCETFELEDAELIAKALNKLAELNNKI